MSQIDATDARLTTHEEICSLRYAAIEHKMQMIDHRFDKIETDIKELKDSNSKTLTEIKGILTKATDEKFKVMVTVAGSIIVALVGMMGYIVIHLK
jgi:hypothetical protein